MQDRIWEIYDTARRFVGVRIKPSSEEAMSIRLLVVLALLVSCSSSGYDISKIVEISADKLAEIKAKPYTGGNGPGGFAAAALSSSVDDLSPEGIRFTGFGPYLHEMGFENHMMITAIDGVGVVEIFADRWQVLRLNDPGAFDAAHYKDLIEYLFAKEPGDHVVLTIDVNVSIASLAAGQYAPETEIWQISFQR